MEACSSSQAAKGSTELCSLVTAAGRRERHGAVSGEGQLGVLYQMAVNVEQVAQGSQHGPELPELNQRLDDISDIGFDFG